MQLRILILLSMLLLVSACIPSKSITESENKVKLSNTGPQLLFVTYKFVDEEVKLQF